MMKVQFKEDCGTKKKGDVAEYRDSYAQHLIDLGFAKKHTAKRETKEEKTAKRSTK